MPMQWVEPEELITHKGVTVYHHYKDDDASRVLEYHFSLQTDEGEYEDFDVRDLNSYAGSSNIRQAIIVAIETKELN